MPDKAPQQHLRGVCQILTHPAQVAAEWAGTAAPDPVPGADRLRLAAFAQAEEIR